MAAIARAPLVPALRAQAVDGGDAAVRHGQLVRLHPQPRLPVRPHDQRLLPRPVARDRHEAAHRRIQLALRQPGHREPAQHARAALDRQPHALVIIQHRQQPLPHGRRLPRQLRHRIGERPLPRLRQRRQAQHRLEHALAPVVHHHVRRAAGQLAVRKAQHARHAVAAVAAALAERQRGQVQLAGARHAHRGGRRTEHRAVEQQRRVAVARIRRFRAHAQQQLPRARPAGDGCVGRHGGLGHGGVRRGKAGGGGGKVRRGLNPRRGGSL